MRNAYNILLEKSECKRLFGRYWEDNIRIDFMEIAWGIDWIHLA
jgi:hypothetical protein